MIFSRFFFSRYLFKISSLYPHEHFSCSLKSVLCRLHASPWLLPSQGSANDLSLNWSTCKYDSGFAFLVTYPSEKAKVAIRAQERFYYTFFLHIFMALPPHWYVFNILCGCEGRVQAVVASTSGRITFQLNYWHYSLAPSHKKLPCHCCNTASVYWLDAQDTLSVLELGSPARQNLVLPLSHWAGCHL